MRYLEQVVKEGLRLYPSVPSFQRGLTEDEQIGEKLNKCSIVSDHSYNKLFQTKNNPEQYRLIT